MSTICKLVTDMPLAQAGDIIEGFLRNHAGTWQRTQSQWPLAASGDRFVDGVEAFPSLFSLGRDQDSRTTLFYNSFCNLDGLAAALTKGNQAQALVLMYQSAASACVWRYYRDGGCLRGIESGDGEVFAEEGAKLPFEGERIGTNIALTGEEPAHTFDSDDMDVYSRSVGLPVTVYADLQHDWVNFALDTAAQNPPSSQKKPFWKFW